MSVRWDFSPDDLPPYDCVASGSALTAEIVLDAYSHGLFPMPDLATQRMYWWSPLSRGVLRPEEFKVSRSLKKSAKRFRVSFDQDFPAVISACADPARDGGWINPEIIEIYTQLFHQGWAHSIEVYNAENELVGGLYGLAIGGLFAGESMFSRATDASKVALKALVDNFDFRLIDVQWLTEHLASLGAVEMDRDRYLAALPGLIGPDPKPVSWVRNAD